jgi:hypothetical protein
MRADEQHGGAVKCYYKEHFDVKLTGEYAVRCFTAKDPHGDRRYSSVPPLTPPPSILFCLQLSSVCTIGG